ncbi:beta-propeller domain-containing protein [Candidatus Bathyarchaeota archaeon]|nr:beta-propeller domain-containing protein [Candidatus Bathyarchaeota archaeon]
MKSGKVVVLALLITVGAAAMLCTDVEYCTATLNKFESYGELKEFLQHREYGSERFPYLPGSQFYGSVELKAMSADDFSKTNVQVEGVDEADIVKTDGEFIYVISGQKVVVVKAYPVEEAVVYSRIAVNGTLKQLFVNEERLVLFYENGSWEETKTFVHVYDIADRENPGLRRKLAVDGCYFSSRMIGDYVYVVVRKTAGLVEDEVDLPRVYSEDEYRVIPATEVYHSDIADYGYIFTVIAAVNVQEDEQEPVYETILSGWATHMYVALENIYLAIGYRDKTLLHRIHIENGEISYVADGEVPGTVLNQFSMDEYEGYFRIATTSRISYENNPSLRLPLQNNMYVLNMELEIVGELENIAPGETIHSARFMGDKCYLVTFRKTDPFFVIELGEPYEPKILGELKISGYSNYLHLYDENHVIGVGKETVPAKQGDFSWYQGVKISLFDVTDLSEPKEIAKYEIGDRGTDSPVLREHKAFLFAKEKNLLVLPVSVAERENPNDPPYIPGKIVWQGAYVFTVSLSLEEKLVLKGTITHIENDDVHDTEHYVTRALYIENVLYTISNNRIKMNSLLDLSEINELGLNE